MQKKRNNQSIAIVAIIAIAIVVATIACFLCFTHVPRKHENVIISTIRRLGDESILLLDWIVIGV